MPYRTPSPPDPAPRQELGVDFWNEPNTYLEARAIQAADSAIVSGLKKLVGAWYKETQRRYPKEYHVLLHDINEAVKGRGTYLRVSGDARYLLGVLVSVARIDGLLVVEPELFDLAKDADSKRMTALEKEAAIRWVSEEAAISRVVEAAFASASGKLDKELLRRYEDFSPAEVMKRVYFRGVAQGDVSLFDDTQLVQDLYRVFYE